MEKYYRLVIDLYKEVTSSKHQINPEGILEVKIELANAITTAKIQGTPVEELQKFLDDVNSISI